MKIRLIFLILLSVLCVTSVNAQNKNNKKITLTGIVMNSSSEPIMNAIIMIDDQKTNSLTDSKGFYKVKVKPTAKKIGIFTFGHGTKEEAINGRTQINFNFGVTATQQVQDQNIPAGEEGVGNGYGSVKKKNLTTTVDKIDGTNKKYASYRSLADMVQREIPGVKISGLSVILQDSKDLFGSVPALIVVDGIPMEELPDIQPINVKSIEVLKGAAASIYGSRGYGGAIVIKTKIKIDEK
jgi:TonB-dependent SusC/RagA subfamily outer membrane receptor